MSYFYKFYAPLQANCPQLADNFIDGLYVADIQRVVAQSKNRPQTADDFKLLFLIPWDHHRRIIDKCKGNMDKSLFFVRNTQENNWGRDVLLNWLDTDLYERDGKAITNFQATLPAVQSDLAQQITKDPYQLDFLNLREKYDEHDIEEEYVVIELKAQSFHPSFLGQLSFYVSAINHQFKTDIDNPTIGLLICKNKDNVVAKYALESYKEPMGISEYQLSKLFPKDFKSSMPTIEELEKGLKGNPK